MADKKVSFELFLISFLALFLELAIMRWLSTEVRIFARFWFPILCVCVILVITLAPVIGTTHVIFVDPRQHFLLGAAMGDHAVNSAPSLFQTIKALSVMVGLYFLVMAVFATLCTKLGELLNRTKPLTGYSINVAGSLCGVATFSLVSFLRWSPGFWLILVFALLIYFHLGRRWVCGYFLIAVGTTTLTGITYPAQWSPYYKVMVQADRPLGIPIFHILVNYDGFQMIQPFAPQFAGRVLEAERGLYNRHYDVPFRLSKSPLIRF